MRTEGEMRFGKWKLHNQLAFNSNISIHITVIYMWVVYNKILINCSPKKS